VSGYFPRALATAKTIRLHDEYTPVNWNWKTFFRQAMIVPNRGLSTAKAGSDNDAMKALQGG